MFKNNSGVIDPAASTLKADINDYIEKNEPGFPTAVLSSVTETSNEVTGLRSIALPADVPVTLLNLIRSVSLSLNRYDGNRTLSFTYDILRFTAKDSTGMIAYDGEDSDFTPSDYITTKTEAANSYPYLLNTSEFSGITESFAPDTGATADGPNSEP